MSFESDAGWRVGSFIQRRARCCCSLQTLPHQQALFFASKIHFDKVQHILQRWSLLQQEGEVRHLRRRRQDRSILLLLSFLINVLHPHRSKSVEVLAARMRSKVQKPKHVDSICYVVWQPKNQKKVTYFYLIFVAAYVVQTLRIKWWINN